MSTVFKHLCAISVLAVGTIAYASAAPILTVTNGTLMGAKDVLVGNVFYDVQFMDGSFNSLFPTGFTNTPWATGTWGVAAANALSSQVFTDIYDSTPTLTNGCTTSTTGICDIFTPYMAAIGGTAFDVSYFRNASTATGDLIVYLPNWTKVADLTGYAGTTYAVWTPSSDVPEPATSALFGLGLAALLARRRRAAK